MTNINDGLSGEELRIVSRIRFRLREWETFKIGQSFSKPKTTGIQAEDIVADNYAEYNISSSILSDEMILNAYNSHIGKLNAKVLKNMLDLAREEKPTFYGRNYEPYILKLPKDKKI